MLFLRVFLLASFTGILVLVTGCGGDKRSKVSGVVTYKNDAVKGGNVYLTNDSASFSSPIQLDGNYVVTDIPPGTYTVTIETETINPDKGTAAGGKVPGKASGAPQVGPGSKGEKMNQEYAEKMGKHGGGGGGGGEAGGFGAAPIEELRKKYVKIPAKYGSKLTSGLTVEVGNGIVVKDLPLAD